MSADNLVAFVASVGKAIDALASRDLARFSPILWTTYGERLADSVTFRFCCWPDPRYLRRYAVLEHTVMRQMIELSAIPDQLSDYTAALIYRKMGRAL